MICAFDIDHYGEVIEAAQSGGYRFAFFDHDPKSGDVLLRSDSNHQWRQGCPYEGLAAGEFKWLQLLTHPEIWVHPGETMGEKMLAMLDAKRERRLNQLKADNIDLS